MSRRKRVGLALSGGVARGPVHVGVLSVFEQAGIPIDCVAGTSAGAIVGAAYCAGVQIPELRALALQANWRTFSRPVWPSRGLVSFARMEPWMESQVGVLDIRDLAIPFAPVATDLESGERVILRRGRLAAAVRASCSVPGVVTPVEIDGRLLCDGGVSDNLPVDAARLLGADFVIGVDLFVPGYLKGWGPLAAGAFALETLVRHAGGGVSQADYLITPDLSGETYFRFSKCRQLIAIGEAAAEQALPHIRRALNL
jgi:NTE family protein